MLDRRLRVLSVIGGEERRAGRSLDMRVKVTMAARRDLSSDSPALPLMKQADMFNDLRLGLVAFFASPDILWS